MTVWCFDFGKAQFAEMPTQKDRKSTSENKYNKENKGKLAKNKKCKNHPLSCEVMNAEKRD